MKRSIIYLFAVSVAALGITACGEKEVKPETSTEQIKSGGADAVAPTAVVSGETVYKNNCVACHQANGEGIASTFPPLAKSDFLSNREAVIEQVIKGKTGEMTVNGVKYNNVMPPQPISDEEIAAVLTYVYSNFGNTGKEVTVDEVKAIRSKLN